MVIQCAEFCAKNDGGWFNLQVESNFMCSSDRLSTGHNSYLIFGFCAEKCVWIKEGEIVNVHINGAKSTDTPKTCKVGKSCARMKCSGSTFYPTCVTT